MTGHLECVADDKVANDNIRVPLMSRMTLQEVTKINKKLEGMHTDNNEREHIHKHLNQNEHQYNLTSV